MILFAAGAGHHEPNAMDHVKDSLVWEIFPQLHIEFSAPWPFTKFHLLMIVAAVLVYLIYTGLAERIKDGKPARGVFWNLSEVFLTFIRDTVARPYISHHPDHHLPFLWTMFLFILFCNLLGMVPFLGSPTGAFSVTATLALIVYCYIHYCGIQENGLAHHFQAFAPHLDLPPALKIPITGLLFFIEFLGLIIKCFVLSVRLFANVFAGHMVLATIILFIYQARHLHPALFWAVTTGSVLGSVALSMLELFVALLQAYIFTFLTALFLGSVLHPEH